MMDKTQLDLREQIDILNKELGAAEESLELIKRQVRAADQQLIGSVLAGFELLLLSLMNNY